MEEIRIESKIPEVKGLINAAILRALERIGMMADGYAKDLCPVDTGNLRNSITHTVDAGEKAVYIGTNSKYGPYVELGTGKYYPGGRLTPWAYKGSDGKWHMTAGQRAKPFLKPAAADHKETYAAIFKNEMENS